MITQIEIPNANYPHDIIAILYFRKRIAGGNAPSPELDMRQISPELGEQIGARVYRNLKERDRRKIAGESGGNLTDSEVYLLTIGEWGIKCPHVWKMANRDHEYGPNLKYRMRICIHCEMLEFKLWEDCPNGKR